jgi:hypothetical protein
MEGAGVDGTDPISTIFATTATWPGERLISL